MMLTKETGIILSRNTAEKIFKTHWTVNFVIELSSLSQADVGRSVKTCSCGVE